MAQKLLKDVSIKANPYQKWKRGIVEALQVNGKHFCYPYLRIDGKHEQSEFSTSKILICARVHSN